MSRGVEFLAASAVPSAHRPFYGDSLADYLWNRTTTDLADLYEQIKAVQLAHPKDDVAREAALKPLRVQCVRLHEERIGLNIMAAAAARNPTCGCATCRPQLFDMRMVLCPICGNKRCPKATHHVFECTGSNEAGQVGSSYKAWRTGAVVKDLGSST